MQSQSRRQSPPSGPLSPGSGTSALFSPMSFPISDDDVFQFPASGQSSNVVSSPVENNATTDDKGCCKGTVLSFCVPYILFLFFFAVIVLIEKRNFTEKWEQEVVPEISLNLNRSSCVSEYNKRLEYSNCSPNKSTSFLDPGEKKELVKSCRQSLSRVFQQKKCADSKTLPVIRGEAFYKELKRTVTVQYDNDDTLRKIYIMCESVFQNNPFGDVQVKQAVNPFNDDLFRNDFIFRSRKLLKDYCHRTPEPYLNPFAEDRSWYQYPETLNRVIFISALASFCAWSFVLLVLECSNQCNKVSSQTPPSPGTEMRSILSRQSSVRSRQSRRSRVSESRHSRQLISPPPTSPPPPSQPPTSSPPPPSQPSASQQAPSRQRDEADLRDQERASQPAAPQQELRQVEQIAIDPDFPKETFV